MKKIVIFLLLICSFETVEARDLWAYPRANAAMEETEEANEKLNKQNEDIIYLKLQVEALSKEIHNGNNGCTHYETVPISDSEIEYIKEQLKYLKSENEMLKQLLFDNIDGKK